MNYLAKCSVVTFVIFCSQLAASAQTTQFWPELDTYVKLNPKMRLFFMASQTREDQQFESAEIGANADFYFKPLVKLDRPRIFRLDPSKSRSLMLRVGYHYLSGPNSPSEQRTIIELTPRYPLLSGFVVADRNRADLRVVDGKFSWRYRNRLSVERTFMVGRIEFDPYVRVEAYYDSNYSKWSRTAIAGGCSFPIGKHFEIEPSYEHQNDTGKSPNSQINGIGLTLSLYFP